MGDKKRSTGLGPIHFLVQDFLNLQKQKSYESIKIKVEIEKVVRI